MKKEIYKSFLSDSDKKLVVKEITEAELKTSGEIRVHIVKKEKINNIMSEAQYWFKKLKMHKTRDRNGILLIIAPDARQFAIFGDKAINEKIEDNFWDCVRDKIQASFKEEKFAEGIISAVKETGNVLTKYFPLKEDDTNELSNEISES
jgi:uncharacterized membrane protein